jgi:hypothetical protein
MLPAPSRREMLVRAGSMAGTLGAVALGARVVWDKGGYGVERSTDARQIRDYRNAERDAEHAQLAIARRSTRSAG